MRAAPGSGHQEALSTKGSRREPSPRLGSQQCRTQTWLRQKGHGRLGPLEPGIWRERWQAQEAGEESGSRTRPCSDPMPRPGLLPGCVTVSSHCPRKCLAEQALSPAAAEDVAGTTDRARGSLMLRLYLPPYFSLSPPVNSWD